jgi:hypothetical protein
MNDGTLADITTELQPGTVIRQVNKDGTVPPFADHVIIKKTRMLYIVSRPYAFKTDEGATHTGCETFTVGDVALTLDFKVVLNSTGAPYIMEI